MRTIKFRAWHKLVKRMVSIDMLDFMLDAYRATSGKWSGSGHLADIELMQYTGLHDANGQEIWEGDIIKLVDTRMPKQYREQIVPVTFEQGCFMFGGFYPYGLEGQEAEVIGNIYENPELLEQTH